MTAEAPIECTRGDRVAERCTILFVVAVGLLIVDPRGDYPLNDDWNFALSAWNFAAHGTFRFARLTGMTLKLQVVWGALWTLLFGRSFFVLRCSTIVAAGATLLLVHAVAWRAGLSRFWRIAAPLGLAANPLFAWSSVTFMTHVPFIALTAAALYGYVRGFAEQRARWLCLASVAVVGSFFIRQTGIAIAAAALAYLLVARPARRRDLRAVLIVASPLLLFVILFLGTRVLEGYPGQVKVHYEIWYAPNVKTLLYRIYGVVWHWTYFTFQYAGITFAPFTLPLLLLVRRRDEKSLVAWLGLAGIFLAVATYLSGKGLTVPYRVHGGGNVIANLAFGPLTLRDTFVFDTLYPHHLSLFATALLSHLAALLGATVLWVMLRTVLNRGDDESPGGVAKWLMAAQSLVSIGLLWISGVWFDRYTIDCVWSLPLLCALVLAPHVSGRTRAAIAVTLLTLGLIVSVGLNEYLRWNAARWAAYRFLNTRGVTLEQMDGGYEINGYLLGGWDGPFSRDLDGASVVDDRYILTFKPFSGWHEVTRFPYETRGGLRRGAIYVLERDSRPSPFHRRPVRKPEFPVWK